MASVGLTTAAVAQESVADVTWDRHPVVLGIPSLADCERCFVFDNLPPPARYVPFRTGTYDVLPGLRPFGEDFGNGAADGCIFQIDSQFHDYRSAKLRARQTGFGRHVLSDPTYEQVAGELARFIAERLAFEHPQWFELQHAATHRRLVCRLTEEVLSFDHNWRWDPSGTHSAVHPRYCLALDALACQVQEDLAVTRADERRNWIAALHVCLPSHWRPEEKLGLDFAAVHAPVPGMEPYSRQQEKFVGKMLGAARGLVRFVWGLQWNAELNRHPACCASSERFDPHAPVASVRVERQTIWGLPTSQASLFTIRPYLYDAHEIKRDTSLAAGLASGIASMSAASLHYKGLTLDQTRFIEWLQQPATR